MEISAIGQEAGIGLLAAAQASFTESLATARLLETASEVLEAVNEENMIQNDPSVSGIGGTIDTYA